MPNLSRQVPLGICKHFQGQICESADWALRSIHNIKWREKSSNVSEFNAGAVVKPLDAGH